MDHGDWNARYAATDLVWGADPNQFVFAELVVRAQQGRALDLACGEGRNAIWLALQGWRVTAVDFSEVAIERAKKLAERRGVEVAWLCVDLASYQPPEGVFQLVLISYLQLPTAELRGVLSRAATALAPTGELLMIGHARRNLSEGVGGPRDPDVLWAPEEIDDALRTCGLNVERCEHVQRSVETPEGPREAFDVLVRAYRPA
ncbi:MAG: class I SAM-dependent methyltransferase [Deltaproteobacteria bacterium]|nr:class I SAM-dependent methyltransferase [Deltaproteobacteria bacterium]